MENYILELYEDAKQKCKDVEIGFDRFDPRTKKQVIGWLMIFYLSCAEAILSVLLLPERFWYLIGIVAGTISVVILFRIDSKDQKAHMEKYMNLHRTKLDILNNILCNECQISSGEQLMALIGIYQESLDKKSNEVKKRNGIIFAIFTAFGGVLSISFENMGLIGMNFTSWLYFATILLIIVSGVGIVIYFYTFFDPSKRKYEIMVKDLKELLLLKY